MQQSEVEKKYLQFAEITAANGFIRRINEKQFAIINIGCFPYQSTQQFYDDLTKTGSVWQKLIYNASKDEKFIEQMLIQLEGNDPWINLLSSIYKKTIKKQLCNRLIIQRYDFICDNTNTPKIVEYNFFAVGITIFMKIVQQCFKQFYMDQAKYYIPCDVADQFTQTILEHYEKRKLKGSFMFVINKETNTFIEVQGFLRLFQKYNIKFKRVLIKDLFKGISIGEDGDLYYQGENISFVYFRHGYVFEHFTDASYTFQDVVQGKIMLANSNTTCIPDLTYEILNMKRIQCELSKPEVMRKYLNEEEAHILQRSMTQVKELSTLSEQEYNSLLISVKQNPEQWILKPNREGGGNNMFGASLIPVLESLSIEERKGYILHEKIDSKFYDNYSINSDQILTKIKCDYELGKFTVTSVIQDQPKFICDCGASVRARSDQHLESRMFLKGIVNCYCGWKIEK